MSQYIRPLLPFVFIVSSTVSVVPVHAQESELSSSTPTSEVIAPTTEVNSSELNQDDNSSNSQSPVISEESPDKNKNVTAQKPDTPPASDRVPIFSRIFPFAPLMRQ